MVKKYIAVGISIRKDILEKIDQKCGGMISRSKIIHKILEKEFGE